MEGAMCERHATVQRCASRDLNVCNGRLHTAIARMLHMRHVPGAMQHLRFAALCLLLAAGCENRSKPKDPPAAKPSEEPTQPAPAQNQLPAQPSPDPAPASDVRPPTAADLAEYTKDFGGATKLKAKIETSMGTFNC